MDEEDPPGPDHQAKCHGHFPHPLSPKKLVGLPGLVPCLPGPPLAMWVLEAQEGGLGKNKRDQWGGSLWERKIDPELAPVNYNL